MIFFILWVVFLLFAIIAVPIAAMLDKKKQRAAYGDYHDGAEEEPYAGEAEEPMAVEDDGFGGAEQVEQVEQADDGFGDGGFGDGGFGDGGFGGDGFGDAGIPDDGGFPAADDDFAAFE